MRSAAVSTWLLAVVLAFCAIRAASTIAAVLEVSVLVVAALGATTMWFHDCFEARLSVIMAVVATTGGTLLDIIVGMPGSGDAVLPPAHVLLLVLGAGTLLALLPEGLGVRLHLGG